MQTVGVTWYYSSTSMKAATVVSSHPPITKDSSSPMYRTIARYALRSKESEICILANPTPITLPWCTRAWLCSDRSAFCTVSNPGRRNSSFWICSWRNTDSSTGRSNLVVSSPCLPQATVSYPALFRPVDALRASIHAILFWHQS